MNTYLRAAKRLETADYACIALGVKGGGYKEKIKFTKLFKPENYNHYYPWFGEINPENQMARSLALLFMHEIEKDRIRAKKKRGGI
jgi:hypothetical protein